MKDHAGMMGHEQMVSNMTEMMNRLSGMMIDMSEMMKDMPKDKMHQVSSMMRDMCSEINRVSELMDAGTATDEEIKAVQNRIMELKKRMSEMGK
jgi:predicted  nucleic acid-binding Zn-ribbon protein